MSKSLFTLRLNDPIVDFLNSESGILGISKNQLIEAIMNLKVVDKDKLSKEEIDKMWKYLPKKRESSISPSFLNKINSLHPKVSVEYLKLFYEVALIPSVNFVCRKNAVFYCGDKFMVYFAFGEFRNQDILEYVKKLGLRVETLGPQNHADTQYMFIGNEQGFKNKSIKSYCFKEVCKELGVGHCDCIRIHYTQTHKLKNILKNLCSINIK